MNILIFKAVVLGFILYLGWILYFNPIVNVLNIGGMLEKKKKVGCWRRKRMKHLVFDLFAELRISQYYFAWILKV